MNRSSLLIGSIIIFLSFAGYSVCLALQEKDRGVDVVVVAEDLQIGANLDESVLQTVTLPSSLAPPRAYNRKSQVVGSIVRLPLIKDELLLPGKVASPDSDTARLLLSPFVVIVAIPAVSVRANGVALPDDGSLRRLMMADVLLAKSASGPRNPQADEIWPGVDVLAVSSRVERSDGGDARLSPVVTFMMNFANHATEYGQTLALAGAQHRVWVALREPPDTRTFCRSVSTEPTVQHVGRPILVSHRNFTGCCGDWSKTDIHVFANGAVDYTEVGPNERAGKMLRTQLRCTTKLDADEIRDLSKIIDSQPVRALPTKVLLYPEGRPIDSSEKRSFEIKRVDGTQEIQVALSPLTQWPPISKPDPQALTQLDCEVEEIQAKTIKKSFEPEGFVRSRCYEVLEQHFRRVVAGFNEALNLLSSSRYSLESVVLDGVGRAWFVLVEKEDRAVSESEDPQALKLSLHRAEFYERLKSDFGER